MRVLMLSDVYFPRINGVSTSIQTFRRDLAALGVQVDLLAPAYPTPTTDDDAGLTRIPSYYLFFDPEDRMMSSRSIRRLLPTLTGRNYTLIHVQTPFVAHYSGVYLARKLGIPIVETYHTHFEDYLGHYLPWIPTRWLQRAAQRFTRNQCHQVNALIVPSRPVLEVMHRYGVQTPTHIIPTGLHLAEFQGGDGVLFRTRHSIDPDRPVLVHVGRVAHEKNIDFLLQVVALVRQTIPDVLLLIVGEGPAQPHLERLVKQLDLKANIRFVGYLDRKRELLDCYRAGDLFVFASRTETQGLVLLEAMALGVPVVAFAAMGTRDILNAQRGAWVTEDHPQPFAEAVQNLLANPVRRAQLAQDAREYAQTWSAREQAQKLVEVYRTILDRFAPTPQE